MKKLTALLILFIPLPVSSAPGEAGVNSLSLSRNPAVEGVAGAMTSSAIGTEAVEINPAGLGRTSYGEQRWHLFEQLGGGKLGGVTFAVGSMLEKGKRRKGGFAYHYSNFTLKDLERRDATSALQGKSRVRSDWHQLSYGAQVFKPKSGFPYNGVYVGGGIKWIQERLIDARDSTMAYDIGAQFRYDSYSLGVAQMNFGPGFHFDREKTPLPTKTTVGLGHESIVNGEVLRLGADLVMPRNQDPHLAFGAELKLQKFYVLRAGYSDVEGARKKYTAGFALDIFIFSLDYSWTPFDAGLDDVHRFSFALRVNDLSKGIYGLRTEALAYYLEQAQSYFDKESYYNAILNANRALQSDPNNPQARKILLESIARLE